MDVTPTGNSGGHIRLTSHPGSRGPARFRLHWGAPTARERGPVAQERGLVVATVSVGTARNSIGAHDSNRGA